jgi:hypothetical protein
MKIQKYKNFPKLFWAGINNVNENENENERERVEIER